MTTLRPGEDHLAQAIQRLKQRPHTSPPPKGLPGELYDRLETALLSCAPADCAPLFVDNRLTPWADLLPQKTCTIDQARAIIATLFTHYNTTHENALVLFLIVLSERVSSADACHRLLFLLASELRLLLKHQQPQPARAEPQ